MSAYIKRDDAIKYNESQVNFCKQEGFPNPEWLHIDSIKNNIKLIPAADVVERKHGEWGKTKQEEFVRCSACDGFVLLKSMAKDFDYCPNCGARMVNDDV